MNSGQTGDNSKGIAVAARIPLLFWLPLVTTKTPLTTFHANQGLVHLISWFLGSMILGFIPVLGWMLLPFWQLANVIMMIIGMVNASQGAMKPLPLVGHLSLIK